MWAVRDEGAEQDTRSRASNRTVVIHDSRKHHHAASTPDFSCAEIPPFVFQPTQIPGASVPLMVTLRVRDCELSASKLYPIYGQGAEQRQAMQNLYFP